MATTELERAYRKALDNLANEERDLHEIDDLLEEVLGRADEPALGPLGAGRLPGGGKVLKDIRGMGKVYDWRTSSWTPSNGGKIPVHAFVHHIPVIRNVKGIADFIRLRDVLVAQGLMVQTATDREGNAALYTPFNSLCYQARGANSFTTGCEHMHFSTSEDWSKSQLRASAWLVNLCKEKHNTPALQRAQLARGAQGVARVTRKGQTTHEAVSKAAGYHDRSDPGPKYDWEYVNHCVRFFRKRGHFHNA